MKKHWLFGVFAAFLVSIVLGCEGADTTPPPSSENLDNNMEADANPGNTNPNTQPSPAGSAQGF